MKKIIVSLALILAGFSLNAQEGITLKSSDVHHAFKTGNFTVSVPERVTAEEVDKLKGYYKDYFTVSFNEDKDELVFTMLKKDNPSFRVVNRMLVGLNIKQIIVDGQTVTFEELVEKYYN